MVLAAGLGTRLRPLTDDRPKALVEVAGRTLLEIALTRLKAFGVRDVIVNVHHFADMMIDYLRSNGSFGMNIEISREDALLDTGGGLKKAAWFFDPERGNPEEPFILHNVDVLSTIDLGRLVRHHVQSGALATLAVQARKSSRYLLFDDKLRLAGRRVKADAPEIVRPGENLEALAFSGVHAISPLLPARIAEAGAFSIIDAYLSLVRSGETIGGFRADGYAWRDVGTPERVAEAERDIASGSLRV